MPMVITGLVFFFKANITLPEENGKYDKFRKRIVLSLDELASPVSPV